MVIYWGVFSLGWYLVGVVWSLIGVVFNQGFHWGGLLLGWSLTVVVFHQGFLLFGENWKSPIGNSRRLIILTANEPLLLLEFG